MTQPRPSKIDIDALPRFVQTTYEQLLAHTHLPSPFPDDPLRALSLPLHDLARPLARIHRAPDLAHR